MGLFDDAGIVATTTDNQPTEVENTAENGEAQVEQEQTSEQPAQEVKPAPATTEQPKKLYADKYETEGGLINGCVNIAKKIGDTKFNVNKLTIPEAEAYYKASSKKLISGDYIEQPQQQPQPVQNQQQNNDVLTAILAKLEDLSKPQTGNTQSAPETAEMVDANLFEQFMDDPAAFQKSLETLIDRRLKPAEQRVLDAVKPLTQNAETLKVQQEKQVKINAAMNKVRQDIAEHGENDFDNPEMQNAMKELLNAHPDDYPDSNPERSFRRLYNDVKLLKENEELKKLVAGGQTGKGNIKAIKKALSPAGNAGSGPPAEETEKDEVEQLLENINRETKTGGIFG